MPDEGLDTPVAGELIWIRRQQWRVRSTHAGAGLTRLVVDGAIDGRPGSRSFLIPCDRWSRDDSRRQRPVSLPRGLAWLAACAARAHPAWTPGSVVDSRTAIFAYQLEPALAMLAGRRRILIADDVGLGKTIQAAVMIAETLRRRVDARVLVIAPASLLTQWRRELDERFAICAHVADAHTFTRLRSEQLYLTNPWAGPGVWLASPDYLKQRHVLDGMPPAPFELMVIDEAHVVAGHSQRHSAVSALARMARHVVLLTATPHDGDAERFNRLVSLAATGARADALTTFRRTRTQSTRHVRRIEVSPGSTLARVLESIDAFERARRGETTSDGLALICGVFRKRALSSIAALASSLARRLAVVDGLSPAPGKDDDWIQPGLAFGDTDGPGPEAGDLMSMEEWPAMRAVTGLPPTRERAWLQRLLSLTARAARDAGHRSVRDVKLERLACLLRRSRESVVVFTEYRDSLLAIAGVIGTVRRVAVLHGGLAGADQRRALQAFLDGDADTLLATDVASQGLNLQHRTRWVVHFDLPWTPMRLEQRIGRVDRIGQSRTVHVTSLGVRHPAQDALRERVARREEARDRAPLPICRRWTRAAEGLARLFARQRVLASCWRGADPVALPSARCTRATIRRLFGRDLSPPITVVEIPLVSDTGAVVERWLAITGSEDDARHVLKRRTGALSTRARRRTAMREAALLTNEPRTPAQPGLFEVRDLAGPRADARHRDGPDESSLTVSVRIGEPRPLLSLEIRT